MSISLAWLALVYSLLVLLGFCDTIGFRGVLFVSTARLSSAGSLINLERWLSAIGALVMGWLLTARKARWCFVVTLFCSLACDLLLLLSLNAITRCLTRGILLLAHSTLVAQVVAVQESPTFARAYVLAHGALATRLGSLLAELVNNNLLWRAWPPTNAAMRVGCACAVFGHLFALALALRITREEGEEEGKGVLSALRDAMTASSPSKWTKPSLPSPVNSSGDLDKESLRPINCLKQVLSQPVLLQLALVQLLAHTSQNLKKHTALSNLVNEFQDIQPYLALIGRVNKVVEVAGLALLIGTGISRFTPQAFICLCFAWEAAMSYLVSLDFATWNPHRRFVSIPVWIGLVTFDHVWDKARDTVITWLLVSAVPREHRGFMFGVCLFMELVPSTPFSGILVKGVHPHGGAVGIFFAAAVMNSILLIVTRKLVLPRYRQKDE